MALSRTKKIYIADCDGSYAVADQETQREPEAHLNDSHSEPAIWVELRKMSYKDQLDLAPFYMEVGKARDKVADSDDESVMTAFTEKSNRLMQEMLRRSIAGWDWDEEGTEFRPWGKAEDSKHNYRVLFEELPGDLMALIQTEIAKLNETPQQATEEVKNS